ncbi:MAG TPA: YqgE/AlgH family protein [Microthrixaceae bacterium]|nr:YqgE/AlgH family protein [Microthrixaceae bacterium]
MSSDLNEESSFVSTQGKLLVSAPDLGDDNFDQAVIFVVEHDQDGAVGLVLNRPSSTDVSEHLPDLADGAVSPAVFFVGGPVSVGGLLALGRRQLNSNLVNAVSIDGPLVRVDPEALVNDQVEGVEAVRLYTGYSGWAPGQLDAELASGVWYVLSAMPDDVLCSSPDALWRSVMKRQGGRLASQSLFPDNPHAN